MKQLVKWMPLLLALMFVLVPHSISYAQDENPITDDEVNELAKELYCPVCENVPLDVCPTQACAQWRELIREKMELGWSNQEIKEYFAAQYGDQVLAVPPRRGLNWLIYVLPPLILIIGIIVVVRILRNPKQPSSTPPSVETEEQTTPPEDIMSEIEQDLRRDE